MSKSHGPTLPPALVERLSQRNLPAHLGRGLPFVTVDPDGRPHPMLLSYLEIRAVDPGALAIVIGSASRTAANLAARSVATLLLVEPDLIFYIKARTAVGPLEVTGQPGLALFLLAVGDVLEDAAAGWEAGMQIESGIRYGPPPSLEEPWARATIAALASARPPR